MFLEEFKSVTNECYKKGWNEMNGGNLTYRLTAEDLKLVKLNPGEWISLDDTFTHIAKEYFLVTGSGRYFQNVIKDIETNSGIIEISADGKAYRVVWGLNDSKPTSELPTHLLNHNVLCGESDEFRVILHVHPTNLIILSAIFESDIELTKSLWKVMTECLVIFPNGIKMIDWMVPGNYEIGKLSASAICDYEMVIWKNHGSFVKGKSFDHAFGMMDTIEKSAHIYVELMKINQQGNLISESNLKQLAKEFNIKVSDRYDL